MPRIQPRIQMPSFHCTDDQTLAMLQILNAFSIYFLEIKHAEKEGYCTPSEVMIASRFGADTFKTRYESFFDMLVTLVALTGRSELYSPKSISMPLKSRLSESGSRVHIFHVGNVNTYDSPLALADLTLPVEIPTAIRTNLSFKDGINDFIEFLEKISDYVQDDYILGVFNKEKQKYPLLGKDFDISNDLPKAAKTVSEVLEQVELQKWATERQSQLEQVVRRYANRYNSQGVCCCAVS